MKINPISVITIRVILSLFVLVVLFFYFPLAHRFFSLLTNTDLFNASASHQSQIAILDNTAGNNLGILVSLLAFVANYFVVPVLFCFITWKISKKVETKLSRAKKFRRKSLGGVHLLAPGANEKSILVSNDQLKQVELAFNVKLAAIKEELLTELRDEIQYKFDVKAEVEACVEKARVRCKNGNYEMALDECNRAIAMEPFSAAYYVRAVANQSLGQNEQSINDLKESARLGYFKAQDYLASKNVSY